MLNNKKIVLISAIIVISLALLASILFHKMKPAPNTITPSASVSVSPSPSTLATQEPESMFFTRDEFVQLDKELNSLLQLNSVFAERLFTQMHPMRLSTQMQEEPKRFVFVVDVPGVDPKAMNISIQNRILTIQAQREDTSTHTKKDTVDRHAQAYFYYRFLLPDNADLDQITAEVKRGVLEISMPKREIPPSKKISIKLASN